VINGTIVISALRELFAYIGKARRYGHSEVGTSTKSSEMESSLENSRKKKKVLKKKLFTKCKCLLFF
jgi:hypothetical protein